MSPAAGADAGAELLPAEIMVQVWSDETLHADAYFPNPDSLAELSHTVRVPPGEYRVTFTRSEGVPSTVYIFFSEDGRYTGSNFDGQ